MLMVKDQFELEASRARSVQDGSFISHSFNGRWPLGPGESRYDFEARGEDYKAEYAFTVEVPM